MPFEVVVKPLEHRFQRFGNIVSNPWYYLIWLLVKCSKALSDRAFIAIGYFF